MPPSQAAGQFLAFFYLFFSKKDCKKPRFLYHIPEQSNHEFLILPAYYLLIVTVEKSDRKDQVNC
jgi:hypothetical protein